MEEIEIDWSPLEVYELTEERIQTIRKMKPYERLAEATRMTNDKRRDLAEQIRRARPNWTEDQVDREYRWVWLMHSGMDEETQLAVREIIRPPSLGYS